MDLSKTNNYAHQNHNQCSNELPVNCPEREPNLLNEETISCDEHTPEINVVNISHHYNLSNRATGKRTYSQMTTESVNERQYEDQANEYNDFCEAIVPQQNWAINENIYNNRTSTPFEPTTEDLTTPLPYEDNLSSPLSPSNDYMSSSSAFRPYSPNMYADRTSPAQSTPNYNTPNYNTPAFTPYALADRSPPALSGTNHDMPRAYTPYHYANRSPSALLATNDAVPSEPAYPTTPYPFVGYPYHDMPRAYTPYHYANRSPSALPATNDAVPSEPAYPTTPYPFVGYPSTAMMPMNGRMPPPPLLPSPSYSPYYGNPYYMTYNPMMPMLPMFNMPHEILTDDVYMQILDQQLQAIYLAEMAEREYLCNYCNQFNN